MRSTGGVTDVHRLIEDERHAYLERLPDVDADWPPDVEAIYRELLNKLFDGGVEAQEVVANCGIGSHEVYTRFRHFTGLAIKEFVIHHRLCLAKRLLRCKELSVSQIAFAVGYASPSGFSATFNRHYGESPAVFRSTIELEEESEDK